ncbi:hypothetical protein K3495_g6136 [Podosphaera aphanis]|nr:hypothetical protein K3495_g6136 [Podosphaera aphanis]
MEQTSQNSTPLFRTAKRRKTYRHRPNTVNEDIHDVIQIEQPPTGAAAISVDSLIKLSCPEEFTDKTPNVEKEIVDSPLPIANVLCQRRKNRRIRGVEFRAEAQGIRVKEKTSVETEGETEGLVGETNSKLRSFSRQTGAVGDVDRHMMAYIDSELAKRRFECLKIPGTAQDDKQKPSTLDSSPLLPEKAPAKVKEIISNEQNGANRQPATLGMLLEIDLGDEVRERNVEMTERARKILGGERVDDIDEYKQGWKGNKVKLGRDGKPRWGRKRRHSDDYKRDQLVDQVLKENRLEIYDEPIVEVASADNDQAADDRIAEAFRREFLDSVSARQRKKAAPTQPLTRGAGGKKEEVLRGPKLGGSRSARAAVRENLLKSSKK